MDQNRRNLVIFMVLIGVFAGGMGGFVFGKKGSLYGALGSAVILGLVGYGIYPLIRKSSDIVV